jgi:hypothetical protein
MRDGVTGASLESNQRVAGHGLQDVGLGLRRWRCQLAALQVVAFDSYLGTARQGSRKFRLNFIQLKNSLDYFAVI